MMRRAIALARRGEGRVEPNPMVGCVIVRGQRVIGEGWHRRFGGPHAEVEALRACTDDARGARVYVSLEPCNHHGQTPPCTAALIDAGVAEVVVGAGDPNPDVRGGGVAAMRSRGIIVREGVCGDEARSLIAPFLTRVLRHRPFVIAKWAQSLDGRLATRTGESKWISSEPSRRVVHRLRGRVDAVMVGVGTVLADDPQLTARDVRSRRRATRVVLDTRLRIDSKCRVVVSARETPTLLICDRAHAKGPRARRLAKNGVEVVGVRPDGARVSLRAALRTLAGRGVTNLLVEGGPTLLGMLFRKRLVDEAHVFVAPILIGGATGGPMGAHAVARIAGAVTPLDAKTRSCGRDTHFRLRFTNPPD